MILTKKGYECDGPITIPITILPSKSFTYNIYITVVLLEGSLVPIINNVRFPKYTMTPKKQIINICHKSPISSIGFVPYRSSSYIVESILFENKNTNDVHIMPPISSDVEEV